MAGSKRLTSGEIDSPVFDYLAQKSAQSFSETLRFAALFAANRHDSQHGTEYGAAMLVSFLGESGLHFITDDAEELVSPRTSRGLETPKVALTMTEVARAIGQDIGIHLNITERLEGDIYTTTSWGTSEQGLATSGPYTPPSFAIGDTLFVMQEPSDDRPYIVEVKKLKPSSGANFTAAALAVMGRPRSPQSLI